MGKINKAFCRGVFCRKTDRKKKCAYCGVYLCDVCMKTVDDIKSKKVYCPDCYIGYILIHK